MTRRSRLYFEKKALEKAWNQPWPSASDQDDDFEGWLCACGHWEESPYHCGRCQAEPPWGCDCSFCQEKGWKDEEIDDYNGEYF